MTKSFKSKPRKVWLDVVRLVAILMVIASHSVDSLNMSTEANSSVNWGAIIGSSVRACVPLFAMMTGLLLFPVGPIKLGRFYKKRILRVFWPLLIWSILYNLFPWFTGLCGANVEILGLFFPAVGGGGSFAFSDALQNIFTIPLGFSPYCTHMWYLYMLIGLYLFMPFFSSWIEQANSRTIRIYLALWLITLFMPYTYQLFSEDVLGMCAWNEFGTLYYFAGFSGYMVLGYYLREPTNAPTRKVVIAGLIFYIVGFLITFTGFDHLASKYSYDKYPKLLEMFWQFCSPNVAMMTIGLFLILQRINVKSQRIQQILANTADCGLGIYLVHYIFIYPIFRLTDFLALPVPIQDILIILGVFFCSWGLVRIVKALWGRKAKIIIG